VVSDRVLGDYRKHLHNRVFMGLLQGIDLTVMMVLTLCLNLNFYISFGDVPIIAKELGGKINLKVITLVGLTIVSS